MKDLLLKRPKTKSAKYKKIERISKNIFFLLILLILSVQTTILTVSIIRSETEDIYVYSITLGETFIILAFGSSAVLSRYKSRLLAYIMISLSYTVSLLTKLVLEDICRIATKHCITRPTDIRVLHLFSICFFIAQTTLAYLIRDALLMADNYFMGRNYNQLEELRDVQKEIMREMIWNKTGNFKCNGCGGTAEDAVYECFEDNRCVGCGRKVFLEKEIEIRDECMNFEGLSCDDGV